MKKTINNNPNELYIFEKVIKQKKKNFFFSDGYCTIKSKWQISYVHNRKFVVRGLQYVSD